MVVSRHVVAALEVRASVVVVMLVGREKRKGNLHFVVGGAIEVRREVGESIVLKQKGGRWYFGVLIGLRIRWWVPAVVWMIRQEEEEEGKKQVEQRAFAIPVAMIAHHQ